MRSAIPTLVSIAKKARSALHTYWCKANGSWSGEKIAILVEGGRSEVRNRTDCDLLFRQESNFQYLTAFQDPDAFAVLTADDANKSFQLHLFVPKLPDSYAVWLGGIDSLEDFQKRYDADTVNYTGDVNSFLSSRSISKLLTVAVTGQSSVEEVDAIRNGAVDGVELAVSEELLDAISTARMYKFEEEKVLMRKSSDISSRGHEALMCGVRPEGMFENELDSLFRHECYKKGGRYQAYNPIVGSGASGATLHYGINDGEIKADHLILVDAGCEYAGYASDITRCFPASGKFSDDQKLIYNIVLKAQKECMKLVKPGVDWLDIHRRAEYVITEGLLEHGFIRGTMDELIENHVGNIFFPHGIGHLIGLDTHDVGGYAKGLDRIDEPGVRYLRMRRILEAGMVVTVEPGLYFVKILLDQAMADEKMKGFLNCELINRFRDFGGVRIEDDLIVTDDGFENLTSTVKEVDAIEKLVAASR